MRRTLLALTVGIGSVTTPAAAQTQFNICDASVEPLLGALTAWVADENPELSLGYTTVATGAALSVSYHPDAGFHLGLQQTLLWPGNLLALADSTYRPINPITLDEARATIRELTDTGLGVLFVTPDPYYAYDVDTSFGDPWFFVAHCASGHADTSIWDGGDFRRRWWLWTDDPRANVLWPRPARCAPKPGRQLLYAAMRHCVLAARPDSAGTTVWGLATFDHALQNLALPPGEPAQLARLAGLRQSASDFLLAVSELWPPAEREPVKLAAYYLQKSAEAWQALAGEADGWTRLEPLVRDELLRALRDPEVNAALALDGLVTGAAE